MRRAGERFLYCLRTLLDSTHRLSLSSVFLRSFLAPKSQIMDITGTQFPSKAVQIIREIADSHFIAFDLEFSGVAGRRSAQSTGKLTIQEYYSDIKEAAEKYQILQVGLTIVKEDSKKGSCSIQVGVSPDTSGFVAIQCFCHLRVDLVN